jgi:hypothetical protein
MVLCGISTNIQMEGPCTVTNFDNNRPKWPKDMGNDININIVYMCKSEHQFLGHLSLPV